MAGIGQYPPSPHPIADTKSGLVTRPWLAFFQNLMNTLLTLAGNVFGPGASVDGEIALWSGTTGTTLTRATGTGVVHTTAGVYAVGNVDLASEVTGRLPYANLTAATAASLLLGRTSASAGDWEEISLGAGLSMAGTTLSATAIPTDAFPAVMLLMGA